jgi:hypothetical protein
MYAEDDCYDEEYQRSTASTADMRCSHATALRSSRYGSEGIVQYSQPSLNGMICMFSFFSLVLSFGMLLVGIRKNAFCIPFVYTHLQVIVLC